MQIGDRVVWQSHAQGNWKTKEGTIVAVVPAKMEPQVCIPASYRMRKQAPGRPRDHESYLVNPDGCGREVLWPLVKSLRSLSSTIPVNVVLPESAAIAQKAANDGKAVCAGCGGKLRPEDLDADGLCIECLEKREQEIEAEETEEARKA